MDSSINKRPALKLEAINLKSLPADRVQIVEREIRDLVGLFEKNSDILRLRHEVQLNVHLTNKMPELVDEINKDFGKKIKTSYNPIRETVVAQGITITHPEFPPIKIALVFDQSAWTKDDGENIALRIYLIAHEIGHVLQKANKPINTPHEGEEPANTHAEGIKNLSKSLIDEFDADIVAGKVCSMILRDDKGQSVLIGEIMGPWYLHSAHKIIDKLCNFTKHNVQSYRETGDGLDGLHITAAPIIGELLLILTHLIAFYAPIKKLDILKEELQISPGFRGFIEKDWHAFIEALEGPDRSASEAEIVRICESVLWNAGLRIEDLADGTRYIHVHEPFFC
jgi:hypothetical protein